MPVYLDYNASTPVRAEALEAMIPHFSELHGNPSSTHHFGQRARAALEEARTQVAALISATPEEVLFVSGGTEANNMVLFGTPEQRPGALCISAVEHPAVYNAALRLKKQGHKVIVLPVDNEGIVSIAALRQALESGPLALVSIMLANNETGVLQPIAEISELCAQHQVPLHVDAAQAAGKILVNVTELHTQYMTLAAHKLGGPIGIGALYIQADAPLQRFFEGGGQEVNRRPGTQAVALAAGFAAACRIAAEQLPADIERITALRDHMESRLKDEISDLRVNSGNSPRLPNTSSIAIAGISAEMMVMRLDLEGFAVSAGSACSSGRTEPSRTLDAMGMGELALNSIRVSLGPTTTRDDIDAFTDTLIRVTGEIRSPSFDLE